MIFGLLFIFFAVGVLTQRWAWSWFIAIILLLAMAGEISIRAYIPNGETAHAQALDDNGSDGSYADQKEVPEIEPEEQGEVQGAVDVNTNQVGGLK